MTREEAIKILRETHDNALFSVRTALETFIPEFRENENEEIRKALIALIKEIKSQPLTRLEPWDKYIMYLEMQKPARVISWRDAEDCEDIPEGHYVVVAYQPGVFGLGYIANGKVVCSPGKTPNAILYIPNALEPAIFEQKPKEQKPIGDGELNSLAYLEQLGYTCIPPSAEKVDKQDYSGLNDLERVIHRGFLAAGVENVPVGIIKDTASECIGFLALIDDKLAEWSEEDKRMVTGICANLTKYCTQYCNKQSEPSVTQYDFAGKKRKEIKEQCDWLESLRPSWKPSEEQMKNFPKWKRADRDWDAGTIDFVVFHKNDGGDHEDWVSVEVTNRLYKGEYYIELSDLDKLPKEE